MCRFLLAIAVWMLACDPSMQAAPRRHAVVLGKPATVRLFVGSDESQPLEIQVRPLYVDGKLKEFTTGQAHDITDQQFTVQRAYRVNDSLPGDERTLPKWRWQKGTWLLVDRSTGRVSALRLTDFDPFYSQVAWYRDFAAYCGVSDTGDKLYAVVTQLGTHKPFVLTLLRSISGTEPASVCDLPVWQRQPARVTFGVKDGKKLTFTIHGRSVDATASEAQAAAEEAR